MQHYPVYTWERNLLLRFPPCHSSLYLQSTLGLLSQKRPCKFKTLLHCSWMYLVTLLGREHQTRDSRSCNGCFQPCGWQSASFRNQLCSLGVWESHGRGGYESDMRDSFSGRGVEHYLEDQLFLDRWSVLSMELYTPHTIFRWTLPTTSRSKSHDSNL